MAATTYRYMGNSILTAFKQKFSNADISLTQVVYWIQNVANKYRAAHIKKTNSQAYLTILKNFPVQVDTNKYLDLSELNLYDFDKNGGIEFITYIYTHSTEPLKVTFRKVSPSEVHRLYMDKYETPSPREPYFFLESRRANLLGIESINLSSLTIAVYSAIDFFGIEKDLDARIDFADEYIEMIELEVIKIMQSGILVIGDTVNDGSDTTAKLNQGLVKARPQQQPTQQQQTEDI